MIDIDRLYSMVQSIYMRNVFVFILLIVSFAISKLVFFLINDPEGPNLLIVTALAMLIFVPLAFIYLKYSRSK